MTDSSDRLAEQAGGAPAAHPLVVPTGRSAQRPSWSSLPSTVRAVVTEELGDVVVEAISQGSGFTPGFASRLVTAGGRRAFVKAADPDLGWLLEAYRSEATKLRRLPSAVPAPRLLADRTTSDGWLVLVFEDAPGRPPTRPWSQAEAAAVLAATVATARALTPPPAGEWLPLSSQFAGDARRWQEIRAADLIPDLVDEAEALAGRFLPRCTGDTLVHTDLRDDNVIIGDDGRVWFCDWNFPTLGPVWTDALTLALSWSGDGLDADALLASSGLLDGADPDDVDGVLALLLSYYLIAARQPPVENSPHLRVHQSWYAEVTADWLRRRRSAAHPRRG